jgi:hypothetical protein
MHSHQAQTDSCDTPASPCATISLQFPEFTRAQTPGVKDSLNALVGRRVLRSFTSDTSAGSAELLMQEFLEGYNTTVLAFPGYHLRWIMRRQVSIVSDTAGVLSLAFFESSFTGGAHPNALLIYATVDLRSGRILSLADIVREGKEEDLTMLAESLFRRTRLLEREDDLEEAGYWFPDGRFRLNENFAFREDGLVFYFNSYEIAPYASGPTELVLPYDSLRGILTLPQN